LLGYKSTCWTYDCGSYWKYWSCDGFCDSCFSADSCFRSKSGSTDSLSAGSILCTESSCFQILFWGFDYDRFGAIDVVSCPFRLL
jgi:hypothetical protein